MEAFKQKGADFVVAKTLPELVRGMNALTDEPLLDAAAVEREIVARDRQLDEPVRQGRADHGHPRRPRLPAATS